MAPAIGRPELVTREPQARDAADVETQAGDEVSAREETPQQASSEVSEADPPDDGAQSKAAGE